MKKKLLFISLIICSNLSLFAQEEEDINPTDKGHFIIDGSINFLTNESKTEVNGFNLTNETSSFVISPKAGYFIVNGLALGLELSFNYASNEFKYSDGSNFSSNSTSIGAGPFARYYLANGIFGQASIAFGTIKTENQDFENKSNFFSYQLGLGYAIFLNEYVSLEPSINYLHTKSEDDQNTGTTTGNGFIFGAGFTIYL